MSILSVAKEHKEAFKIFYDATNKHLLNNQKIYRVSFNRFKKEIEQDLLQLAADKLTSLFGDEYMNKVIIEFDFYVYSLSGNSGGMNFIFDDNPEVSIFINFNKDLKLIYKKDMQEFCLTLSDIFTHELIHGIQCIKQYKSVGIQEDRLKESMFKNKEYLFKLDKRYKKKSPYYEDLPYFSKYEELVCYSKDAARQLLSIYKDKKTVFSKLSSVEGLEELAKTSDCFYYYYDCFYDKTSVLKQYGFLWKRFVKHLYRNLNEDFMI
jgi:hypothetical protein